MNNLVVVGCQWGDEGKGKLVDYLGEKADIIVRFQRNRSIRKDGNYYFKK